MALKVFVEKCEHAYQQMFLNNGWELADTPKDADLIQFVGGADVSPNYYGEEQHPRTYCNEQVDKYTLDLYEKAAYNNIPMAGICRGSQFLCVMGGGKLWQDVDGHAVGKGHALLDVETGTVIENCSSTHHQQHRPADNAIIIAESFPQLCTFKGNGYGDRPIPFISSDISFMTDVESFYYPHINAIGFQPHPEFFHSEHPCQMYYFDIIAKYLKLRSK